ncbi:MAG TPA: PAS domain S-box protein [Verrucomicrobiae bacterium]|nr:PAS domain S-box protein [Verrucomicrobiae bacterium]
MRFFTNASIKRKQVLIILLTSAATLLLACTAFVWYDATTFRKELVEQASSLADIIGRNCTAAVDFNDTESAEETLGALHGERNILAAAVFKRDGARFAMFQRIPSAPVELAAPRYLHADHQFTNDSLILIRPMLHQKEAIGTIVVVYDLKELSERLKRYLWIVAAVFAVSLLVAFVLSAQLQRVISQPIQSLARAARAVAIEKDYSVRVKKESEDELGQLIVGFNEMLSQIQERDCQLQSARDQLENRVHARTAELASSLSLLNATLESTADGILVVAENGRVTKYNTKFLKMWSIGDELISQRDDSRLLEFVTSQVKDSEAFLSHVRELYDNREAQSSDIIELTDGRVFERHTQPQNVSGKYVGRVWCFRDITERKKAEEALRERLSMQERLARIAATVPGVIHTFRLNADGTTCMPYASPRVEEVYGVSPQEVEHDASVIFSRIHPDDTGRVRASIEESKQAMTPWRDEFRVRHPDVGEIWVELHSVPTCDSDGAVVWHGFLSNITERKKSEAKIAALNKELIETSRQAGMAEVATGVLHNVGNVLNSVNISATLVADGIQKSKAANLPKVVALFEEHGERIGEFIARDPRGQQLPRYLQQLSQQLILEQKKNVAELDLLRKNIEHIKDIVAMQQSYAKVSGITETVAVVELVEDALQMNAGALSRHEVEVVREFSPVPTVTLEKHKVLQILVNLIRNAKFACDESGRSDKRITVRVAESGGTISIAVADNGIGIPPENMTRIFSHGFTTRKQGHGFGLHSGALVAKEMGGILRVCSDGLGRGATFILELPIAVPKAR